MPLNKETNPIISVKETVIESFENYVSLNVKHLIATHAINSWDYLTYYWHRFYLEN